MSHNPRRRRNQLLLTATAAISFYASYKLISNCNKLNNLIKSISLFTNAFTSSADTINLLLTDLNVFIKSPNSSDQQIPNSLIQLLKLFRSNEFSSSISKISEAATVGVVKGVVSESSKSSIFKQRDKLIDKLLFSKSGSGFVSLVVGSFAKNLVLNEKLGSSWVEFVHDAKCRAFVAESIQIVVRNMVTVYLDKTKDANIYNEFMAGVMNPKHEGKVKDILVTVCNGAVETFIRTSHQILMVGSGEGEQLLRRREERMKEIGKWVSHVSTTLAVPSNRRLVLDLTGRVTFETVKSFLEFVVRKGYVGVRKGANVFRGEISDRGLDMVRYCSARSMFVAMICVVICLHALSTLRESDSNA